MGYIGKTPTPAALTASDITDGIVTSAKIADGTIATADIADSAVTKAKTTGITSDPFRNLCINGDMSISQRGTSTTGVTTTDGYYACDRWYTQTDTGTWTISQSNNVPTGQGYYKSLKLDCTTAGTSNADEVSIRHKIEGQNVQYLKFGTSNASSLTVSFWIKSNKTGTYSLSMVNSNSTQERIASFNYTISSADTWEKKTITFPGDTARAFDNTNGEELTLYWWFSAASGFTSGGVQNTWTNYSANYHADSGLAGLGGSTDDNLFLTGVQLEAGTSASDFEFLPFDINLRRCHRYFCTTDTVGGTQAGYPARAFSSSGLSFSAPLPVPMRSAPSVTLVGTLRAFAGDTATYRDSTSSLSVGAYTNLNSSMIGLQSTGFSGITDNKAYNIMSINDTQIKYDSEL